MLVQERGLGAHPRLSYHPPEAVVFRVTAFFFHCFFFGVREHQNYTLLEVPKHFLGRSRLSLLYFFRNIRTGTGKVWGSHPKDP
jgi:hypothetical protein